MIFFVPWLMAIGVAVYASFVPAVPERKRRSIEVCVGSCTAAWLSEDGVIRVYAEESTLDCHRIVVECSTPPLGVPGEFDGRPVQIRIDESMGQDEAPEQKSARLFAQVLSRAGYDLRASKDAGGKVSVIHVDPEHRRASFVIEGSQISPAMETQATWICEVVGGGVRPSYLYYPPLGPGHPPFVLMAFEARR